LKAPARSDGTGKTDEGNECESAGLVAEAWLQPGRGGHRCGRQFVCAAAFTFERIDVLALGLFAESLDDRDLAAAAREVRERIQAGMPDPAARRLSDASCFALRRWTGDPQAAVRRSGPSRRRRPTVRAACAPACRLALRGRPDVLGLVRVAAGFP
jgi:hypothetical protein